LASIHRQASGALAQQSNRRPVGTPARLQVAALPWRRNEGGIEILLVTTRDTGRWVLPKGWPERREELFHAAAREAMEEAGVKGLVSKVAIGRYFYLKATSAGDTPCEVSVFPLEVMHLADRWKEDRERTRTWMSGADASRVVREPKLRELILDFSKVAGRDAA
jgi:8-oxo-dGTP pyrophosphatase MutT (NUDIX family)